ncbi:multidrug effflux MFS transporter [Streptantibioticus silvisoli]|uniref:Multidrug effflux MFS transporter n=1 Tax=Streptantibioticus silvisoli TaxID=2705255 RepID=A0ABT6VT13_9ACTN|nr:multidrug effflux MFS transporter [Streptantibioticus silvisoli]MDI5961617.1 multidrug effflux MFS transporter [Streptantibioticus silvisoli]
MTEPSPAAPTEDRIERTAPPAPDPQGSPSTTEQRLAGPVSRRSVGMLVTLAIGALTALPSLSIDMYLPSLPAVTKALHAPAATVQITLTGCLLGMALGQLVVGPMSDKWGRRRPLLTGMVIYILATAACAFAPDVELLITYRLLQGLAGAAAVVIARAVVRDLYDGEAMARFFSTLMLISGVAPIAAPVIGGQILRFTDWRGVFVVLTVVGTLLTVLVAKVLPETLPVERRHAGGLGETLRTVRALLMDGPFSGYMLAGSFAFAALFAYVSGSAFVVQDIFGASPQTFSLVFMANSIGLVAIGQLNGKVLIGRVSLDRALGIGLSVIFAAATYLLLLTCGVFGRPSLFAVVAGFFVLMSAMGLAMPNTNALALMRTPNAAGSASALLGTSQFLIGAIASPLVGVAGSRTAVPMALVQVCCTGVAAAAFLGLCRPWRSAAGR